MFSVQNGLHFVQGGETAIYYEIEVWVEALQLEDPVVFEWRNCSVLLRIQPFQESFTSVYNEFGDTSLLTDHLDKIDNIFPLIVIVDPQSTLHSHGDATLFPHLFTNACHQVRIEHKHSTKGPTDSFVGGAATIYVHLIVAPLLNYLGCLAHLYGIVAAQLTNHRMLDV